MIFMLFMMFYDMMVFSCIICTFQILLFGFMIHDFFYEANTPSINSPNFGEMFGTMNGFMAMLGGVLINLEFVPNLLSSHSSEPPLQKAAIHANNKKKRKN